MSAHSDDPIRVLLVEDNPDDAELVLTQLRREGLDVEHDRVESEAGLKDALNSGWDLVISDYAMPGFDGLHAARIVRERAKETPFIFVSGVIGQERAINAMQAGVRDYFPKDDLARLGVAVRREIEAARTRREERARVRRARDFAQSIVSSMPTPVVIMDGDGLIVATNPAFDETFDITPRPREDRFAELLPELASHDVVATAIENAAEGEQSREIAMNLLDDDGPRSLVVGARPLPAPGTGTYSLLSFQDVTEWRRQYDQLVGAQRLESVGRLAGGVAHDFNNMLTVIQNFAVLLQEEDFEAQSPGEIGDIILEVSERASELTQQLLAFGSSQPEDPIRTDFNEIVAELMPILRRLGGDDVDFEFDLDDPIGRILVDRAHMEQVVINLVSNAIESTGPNGTIRIETRNRQDDADWVVLAVDDDGVGMDEAIQKHAFEPFFTTREFGRGAGLGLSTVYGTVKQFGGHVAIDTQPGEGTRIEVCLPAHTGDDDEGVEADEEELRILIVDDDNLVRRSTRRILERSEFEVFEADRGRKALDLLAGMKFDLMLVDVLMPEMGGVELVEEIQRRYGDAGPRVVLASGYTADELASDPESLGVAFIRKPFRPNELVDALLALVE